MLLTTDTVPALERVGHWGDLVQRSFGRLRSLEDPSQARRSITSILLGAGFSSAAHFSRMFRQRYGASPREWRAHGGHAAATHTEE